MSFKISTTIKKSKLVLMIILFKFILELSYIYYLVPLNSYEGFHLNPDTWKIVESYIFVILIAIYIPIDQSKPSSIAVNVLNIFMVVPMLTLYGMKDESRFYLYAIVFSFLLLIFLVRALPKIANNNKVSANDIVYLMFFIIGISVYFNLIYYNGLPSLELLDLTKVYSVRGTVDYGSNIMYYLVPWQATIINIFLIVIFWKNKKWKLFFLMCLLQLILYLITSHKTYLFYPILVPFLIMIIRRGKFIGLFIIGTILVVVLALFFYFIGNNTIIPAMFINRVLFLPAQISFQYYEFFSSNGLVYLSHSILSPFFEIPIYSTHPISIIGEEYYKAGNWANTGYLGDAYMNFGVLGMLFFSFILAVILRLFDSLSNTTDKSLITSSFVVFFMFLLTNGALLTNLLNGGLLFYIFILYLYNDRSTLIQNNSNKQL